MAGAPKEKLPVFAVAVDEAPNENAITPLINKSLVFDFYSWINGIDTLRFDLDCAWSKNEKEVLHN